MQLLKSTNQYIDVKGQVYTQTPNGNIDDMVNTPIGNVKDMPDLWWNTLSAYDRKIVTLIQGEV